MKGPRELEEVCICGVLLLEDERSNVILPKFLRARDFNVKDSFEMLKSVAAWRKEFRLRVNSFADERLGSSLEKSIFVHGSTGRDARFATTSSACAGTGSSTPAFRQRGEETKVPEWHVNFLEKSIGSLLDMSP